VPPVELPDVPSHPQRAHTLRRGHLRAILPPNQRQQRAGAHAVAQLPPATRAAIAGEIAGLIGRAQQ